MSIGAWTCPQCLWENDPGSNICDGCESSRGVGLGADELPSRQGHDADVLAHLLGCLNQQTAHDFIEDLLVLPRSKLWSDSDDAISVISPTGSTRHRFHPFLYWCFCQQSYQQRELIVIDTGDMTSSPSAYFTQGAPAHDPRVIYRHFKTKDDWTIGATRTVACLFASGNVVAHFDDDDIYAPSYLALIMNVLRSGLPHSSHAKIGVSVHQESSTCNSQRPDFFADAVTFQTWFTLNVAETRWGICHPSLEENRSSVLGYGFSFAYLRSVWCQSPFKDMNLGEDFDLFQNFLAIGARIALLKDGLGMCAHANHRHNCSGWEDSDITSQASVSNELVSTARRLQIELKVPTPVDALMELSVDHCVAFLREVVDTFKTPACQAEFHKVAKKASPKEYYTALREVCVKYQAPLMPKYGFEASLAGLARCQYTCIQPYLYKSNEGETLKLLQFTTNWLKHPHWQQRSLSESWKEFHIWAAQPPHLLDSLVSKAAKLMRSVGIEVPRQYCR